MNKEKFISSALILLVGGLITKLLGMVIRIMTSRLIGTEGLGLYMMISPAFNLFVTVATFGFPVSISKLVAEERHNNKKLLFSLVPLIIILNVLMIAFTIFSAPYIANNLLKDSRLYYPLLAVSLTLPFISISNLIRGYFFGKQKMVPHVVSNIVEQVVRMAIILLITPTLLKQGLTFAISGIISANIVSELSSIIVLYLFLPRKLCITKNDLKPDVHHIKDVVEISLPTTGSRLIGSLGYFLEPIILTNILLLVGYSNKFIVNEYGIISGYVLPMLMMPSFFSLTISSAALPILSKAYASNKYTYVKKKIKQTCLISIIIGIICTIFFMLIPDVLLDIFYNTTEGKDYLKIMAPFFLFLYIQSPLTYALQACDLAKESMFDTLGGIIFKLTILCLLSLLKIGLWPLIIGSIFNVIYVTLRHMHHLKKRLSY